MCSATARQDNGGSIRLALSEIAEKSAWVTAERHRYKALELWYPLSNHAGMWEAEFHELMLRDYLRMSKFREGIWRVVRLLLEDDLKRGQAGGEEPDRVIRAVDLGTGYGILAYWVAKSYEEICGELEKEHRTWRRPKLRVYALEGNPVMAGEAYNRFLHERLVFQNVIGDTDTIPDSWILVCPCSSYVFTEYLEANREVLRSFDPFLLDLVAGHSGMMKRPWADLVVTETFGAIVDNEDVATFLPCFLSEHLKPDGICIPQWAESYLVPVNVPELHEQIKNQQVRSINPAYLERKPRLPWRFTYDSVIPKERHVVDVEASQCGGGSAAPCRVWRWQFANTRDAKKTWVANYRVQLTLKPIRDATIHGLKGFFRMQLAPETPEDPPIILDIGGDTIDFEHPENKTTCDCWKHLFLPLEKGVGVTKDRELTLSFSCKVDPGLKSLEDVAEAPKRRYRWSLEAATGGEVRGEYESERPFQPGLPLRVIQVFRVLCENLESLSGGESLLPETMDEVLRIWNNVVKTLAAIGRDQGGSGEPQLSQGLVPELAFLGWPNALGGLAPRGRRIDTEEAYWIFPLHGPSITPAVDRSGVCDLLHERFPIDERSQGKERFGGLCVDYTVIKKDSRNVEVKLTVISGEDVIELLDAQTANRGDRNREQVFRCWMVIPDPGFLSNPLLMRREPILVFLMLQSEILVRLLVRQFEQRAEKAGRERQFRATMHEIAQLVGYLIPSESAGWLVQPALEQNPRSNTAHLSERENSTTSRAGTITDLDRYEQIVYYLTLWAPPKIFPPELEQQRAGLDTYGKAIDWIIEVAHRANGENDAEIVKPQDLNCASVLSRHLEPKAADPFLRFLGAALVNALQHKDANFPSIVTVASKSEGSLIVGFANLAQRRDDGSGKEFAERKTGTAAALDYISERLSETSGFRCEVLAGSRGKADLAAFFNDKESKLADALLESLEPDRKPDDLDMFWELVEVWFSGLRIEISRNGEGGQDDADK